ncbi:hypothetical protein SARC_05474 [Sphaeroforma arctica JP610]|uniref:Uncharacterized protein n=1 Tax=Sphaeroforma arctica JP610 TaxID=667725 RepID=A0A0L0FZH5_9EUKA|nr:hypothetical protein SARC_05474 [Sphaeroforma arctica JP610]KNC82232.1 hypothetical protein SARC_05474 [Sphaeroforma arctica JP610]|eukprot:XP_014156134.1 hypothetical protein SARC_05474 [Sphaeroforma arctica JP610]
MATQYHSNALKVSDSDVVPAGWEECALLAATCLLFIATRESYSAQQAVKDLDSGEDGDGSMSIQTVRSDAHFHYVLAQENSRELTALVKLMQAVDPNDIVSMATDESSSSFPGANQISLFVPSSQNGAMNRVNGRVTMATPKPVVEYYSDFSIVIMHAVYYGVYAYTSVHCNTEVKLITNLLDGPWKSRTLQSVYSLFLATTMERGLVDGDTVQHDEYLAKALQHTVPATDRAHDTLSVHPTTLQLMGEHQLIGGDGSDGDVGRENVLRILRTRVVTSLFIEGSENRELFLRCYEEIMGCVYLMKKDEWLRKSQSITEMIVLREFVDLWGALYKDWPEGTLVLLRTECLERLLAYGFDVPEEAQDFKLKAQHCLAVYASFIGMLGSLCNSSECSAQLTAAIKYREDRLSWKRFKEFIDDYVRDLDPSRRAYANGGRIPAPAASMGTYTQGGNYGNYDTSGNHGNYDPHWNGSQGGYAQNLRPTFGSQRAFEGNGFGQQQHTLQDTHMYERRDSARNMDTANDKDAETDQDMPQIDPTDEKGLRLILRLIRRACRYPDSDAVKHIAYKWEPVGQLFKLLTCRIPLTLRAAVMRTIAAFAITPAHAYELWSVMDEHNLRDVVLVDRQALEAKDGVYPLTIAFLELLHVLLNATDHLKLTNTLGLPRRVPGLAAYLRFVVDVFVLAQDAAFVYESERWKVFKLCSGIFEVVLTQYKISPAHFYDRYYSPDNAYTDDPLLPLTTQQDLQQQQQTRSAFSDPDSSLYPDGSLSADSSLIAPTHVCQSERANRPPGMQLLTEFLTGNKQPLVKGVLRLLERGVSALTRAKNMAKRNAQCKKLHARAEICIRSSLRLIHAVLVSQADFIHFAISAGSKNCLPTLVPLEKHVISADKHPVMGHTNSVKAIAQFVSYDCAEIASLSVRIMTLLSQALVSGPKLVPLVRDTQIKAESYVMGHVSSIDSDRRDFMMGYVQRLVQRAPRVPTLDTAHTRHSDKYTRDNRLTRTGTGSTTRPDAAKDQNLPHTPSHDILEEIVQLLIVNLTDVPFPNVAHYILGYDLNTPETTDLRRERSCLYHIHAMVQMGVHERSGRSHGNGGGGVGRDGDRMYEAYMGTQTLTGTGANGGRGQRMGRGEEGETLFQFNPKLSELCYRLIYLLCTQVYYYTTQT